MKESRTAYVLAHTGRFKGLYVGVYKGVASFENARIFNMRHHAELSMETYDEGTLEIVEVTITL